MAHGPHETEIKLAVPGAKAARRLLRQAGFRVSRGRVFEANTLFDTPRQTLREAMTLLRIREAGGLATVTYKGKPVPGRHKSREELELTISDPRTMTAIVERLGFQPSFHYEKFRTEFRRPRAAGVATLDETPIGTYMELEGSPRWIDGTAAQMGFAEPDYITASYGRLYLDWCAQHGLPPTNMVFPHGIPGRRKSRPGKV